MSKISVIIPCYNASEYICRCLDALENQTYKDFSVVVIDDCSRDNTIATIETYREKLSLNIQVLRNEKNSGPAFSRNKGIERAESKYISFCDADDWYEPEFLATLMETLEKHDAEIGFCGYRVINENGVIQERPIVSHGDVLTSNQALQLESDSLCMLLVKTEIMQNTLLPNIRNGEDVAVVPLLIAKSRKIIVTEKCLYNYYRRSYSASQNPNANVVQSLRESFEYLSNYFPQDIPLELEFLGIKNMLYPTLISLFSYSYDIKTANDILDGFEKKFPNWNKNPYIIKLNKYKIVVLFCAGRRWYYLIKIIAFIRSKLV